MKNLLSMILLNLLIVIPAYAGPDSDKKEAPDPRAKKLQSELNLTDEQSEQLHKLMDEIGEMAKTDNERFADKEQARNVAAKGRQRLLEKRLAKILTSDQMAKYLGEKERPRGRQPVNRMEELKEKLSLTDEQVKAIEPIMNSFDEKMREIRQGFDRNSMDREAMEGVRQQMQVVRKEMEGAIGPLLTEEQKVKYQEYGKETQQRRGWQGHGDGQSGQGGE